MQKFILISLLLFMLFLSNETAYTQIKFNQDNVDSKDYSFIIQDSPFGLNTMRQSNQNYYSLYRLISNELYRNIKPKTVKALQIIASLYFIPFTHEEAHRSILTSLKIGSVSRPLIDLRGVAIVNGVSDETLEKLRLNNLPNYLRLHTAGIESDYMLAFREEKDIMLNVESKKNIYYEVLFRKFISTTYFTFSLIPSINPKLKEETNELERDIVGHDVYGVVKNLFRPNERFYRYTNYDDLTNEELRFLKRVGYRALINAASPIFFKKLTLVNKPNTKLSLSAGYTMSPFGDFIDENLYLLLKNKYKIHTYLRQFENKQTWFPAGGVSLTDYEFSSKFSTDVSTHVWTQPDKLDFNTTRSVFGGAVDVLIKYKLLNFKAGNSVSLDLGAIYKTKGFLPEQVQLNEHFGVRLGCTLNLIKR